MFVVTKAIHVIPEGHRLLLKNQTQKDSQKTFRATLNIS